MICFLCLVLEQSPLLLQSLCWVWSVPALPAALCNSRFLALVCRVLLGVGKSTLVCNRTIPKHAAPCLKVPSRYPWWRDQISSKSPLHTSKRYGTSSFKKNTRSMNDEMKKCICIMGHFERLDYSWGAALLFWTQQRQGSLPIRKLQSRFKGELETYNVLQHHRTSYSYFQVCILGTSSIPGILAYLESISCIIVLLIYCEAFAQHDFLRKCVLHCALYNHKILLPELSRRFP